MPLLKRKPVHLYPLPSLTSVLLPIPGAAAAATDSTPAADADDEPETLQPPADGKDDDEQLDRLLHTLTDPSTSARRVRATPIAENLVAAAAAAAANGDAVATEVKKAPRKSGAKKDQGNGVNGIAHQIPEQEGTLLLPTAAWRVKNLEVFYIPETGEIFLDYESYAARRAFFNQTLFQCEVSGKSALSYFKAQQSEAKEVRQLHSRFPRQLKKAVLSAVQFQVEGKLETLVDRIFERFHNRFFDDEKVFVDVQGDKYLARVAKTFPPKNLHPPPEALISTHPYATDLSLTNEAVNELDDPMKYFYAVRLIREGGDGIDAALTEDASTNGHGDDDEGGNEQWQTSFMEVQADKISRDRINFSRAMLKRFIRDCVHRDSPVYSPWLVKPSVAARYGLPREMSEAIRLSILNNKEKQMDKRKREREERLGITNPPASSDIDEDEEKPQKKKKGRAKTDKEKEKEKEEKERKAKEAAEVKAAEEAAKLAEEEARRKKPSKYPAEDLLVEYAPDRDAPAGRIEVRPAPSTELPFGTQFEQLLMAWSFLNVMGQSLHLSPFSLDDFEQSLYHSDPYTAPSVLTTEIHAALLNALVRDFEGGTEATSALAREVERGENDTDYWEGHKGATAETIRPVASGFMASWKRELSARDGRRGWEGALIGCLWERATLESLPHYLDNILHMTHEDKPAPTRPTWSTGPATAAATSGLIVCKPEKKYPSLHHTHKLDIISFLIEMVAQTSVVREFMEESTAALTEVRKEQVDLKRDLKRIQTERAALEPKPEEGEEGEQVAGANGDDAMEGIKASPPPSTNGHANGGGTERDELDSIAEPGDRRGRYKDTEDDGLSDTSRSPSPDRVAAGNRRRQAMREKAAEREAEEAVRAAKRAAALSDAKVQRANAKQLAVEKKRLTDEETTILGRIKQLDIDFRAYMYTLRARPMGSDRFGNKIWWIDGLGSAPLMDENGKVNVGTGRVMVQGGEELEVELWAEGVEVKMEEVEERRGKEEQGRLKPGQWGVYDSPEQLHAFVNWLNPRGIRELQLLRQFKLWLPEIESGMRRRRLAAGLDQPSEDEHRRVRPSRKSAGGAGSDDDGFLAWKNTRRG